MQYNLKNDRMISIHFQGKPFIIMIIQVYAPTSNAEKAEVEWFYEDLQDLLVLTPKKDILFIIEGFVGHHRTVQLQLLQCYWSGHRLGLL